MAKRKSDMSINNISFHNGVQSTDMHTVVEEEKNLLSGLLEGQYNEKYTNLNKLSSARTVIVYFRQVPISENNGLVNLSGFNFSDPNLTRYIRIENFSCVMEQIDSSYDETDGNGPKSVQREGKLIILPNTILPLSNDYFIFEYMHRTRLFRVTDVTPVSADNESAYEVSFVMVDNSFVYDGSQLQKMVVEEEVFEENYLGTKLRTVYRKSEYSVLEKLKILYNEIGIFYKEKFWRHSIDTYILNYENNIEESPLSYKDQITVIGVEGEETIDLEKNKKSNFNINYLNRYMYDGDLIEFITRNRIFEKIEGFPTIPSQYSSNRSPNAYNKTLFYALEKQNKTKFVYRYQMPVELSLASIGSQPTLYGMISLIHVPTYSDSILSLFPQDIYELINLQVSKKVPIKELDQRTVYDLIKYLIVFFINKEYEICKNILISIYDKKDTIEDMGNYILMNEIFYIIPILGYIIKEFCDYITDSNSSNNVISDPLNYKKDQIGGKE